MSESNKLNTEEIVKQNSVSCPGISSKYWDDFPEDFVLYIETSYDIQKNQLIAHNLEEIQKIYAAHTLIVTGWSQCFRAYLSRCGTQPHNLSGKYNSGHYSQLVCRPACFKGHAGGDAPGPFISVG